MTDDTPIEPVLEFPCDMYIKAMGSANINLKAIVLKIALKTFPHIEECDITVKASKGGKYESITLDTTVQTRAELDSIYADLKACEHIIMVL